MRLKNLIRTWIVLLLVLVFIGSSAKHLECRENFTLSDAADYIVSNVKKDSLYDYENLRFKSVGSIPTCRSEFRFALCLLSSENTENHKLGNLILKKYLLSQVKDTESPYYGAWYYPEYLDKKSGLEWDMFVPVSVFQIYFENQDRLQPEVKKLLKESIKICCKGLVNTWFSDYKSTLTHTNYHLLYVCDLLLSSEISGNAVGEFFAKVSFDAFIRYTLQNGVHEFNSPTYQAVDLQALYLIEKYSSDPVMKTLAKNWANFILTDLVIHYLPSKKRFSGANSRSYNVFSGSGGTVKELERQNQGSVSKDMISDVGDIAAFFYDHKIPEWLQNYKDGLGEDYEFKSKWSDDPWSIRQTVFNDGFIIGSSGKSYGSQDRNLVIEFPGGDEKSSQFVPVISVNKTPWKLPSIGGGSGHNHLRIPVFTNHDEKKLIQFSHILFSGVASKDVNRIAQTFITPKNLKLEKNQNSFCVKDGNNSVYIKPFFIGVDTVPRINMPKNLPFPGGLIDFEMVRFNPGKVKIDGIYCGFALETFDNNDAKPNLDDWCEDLDFEVRKSDTNIFCRFESLEIDYNTKNRYPENTPFHQVFNMTSASGICVDDGYFVVNGNKIPLTFETVTEKISSLQPD